MWMAPQVIAKLVWILANQNARIAEISFYEIIYQMILPIRTWGKRRCLLYSKLYVRIHLTVYQNRSVQFSEFRIDT